MTKENYGSHEVVVTIGGQRISVRITVMGSLAFETTRVLAKEIDFALDQLRITQTDVRLAEG